MAVYRLWKCHGNDGTGLDDLGLASSQPVVVEAEGAEGSEGRTSEAFYGGRGYWFNRTERTYQQCIFPEVSEGNLNFTAGTIDPSLYSIAKPAKFPLLFDDGLPVYHPNATYPPTRDLREGLTVQVG